jgi:hypothetical protein
VLSAWLGFDFIVNLHRSEKLHTLFAEPRQSLVRALSPDYWSPCMMVILWKDQLCLYLSGDRLYKIIKRRVYISDKLAVTGLFELKIIESASFYKLAR